MKRVAGALGLLLVIAAAVAGPGPALALDEGAAPPLLHIDAVAGQRAGESFCYSCWKGLGEYGVVFIKSYDGMVRDFVKQLDADLADRGEQGVAVVLLQSPDEIGERVRGDLGGAELGHVTVGFPSGEQGAQDVKAWGPSETKQTSVYLAKERKVTAEYTAGCPHCEGIAKRIADGLE
jgi:hypothetical protein